VTRWAVVSDIHGNLPALEAVRADAGAVDGWLNLGDLVSGPLWPRETAAMLMSLDWPTIAGNHERQLLTPAPERMGPADAFAAAAITPAQRRWLAALPFAMAPADGLACVHGAPGDDLQYLLETVTPAGLRAATPAEVAARLGPLRAALLLCGHTHVPRDVTVAGRRIANPGSVGLPAYDDDHPWPHVVENGSPAARYAVVERDAAGWRVALREVAYDHETAARRAEANGRGDWADALRTGRVGRREAEVIAASRAAAR
jgi:diadenosine tetraphosphatase ApaH/serine/threonine PP2A family protein phosphatase